MENYITRLRDGRLPTASCGHACLTLPEEVRHLYPPSIKRGYAAILTIGNGKARQRMYPVSVIREHIDELVDAEGAVYLSQNVFRSTRRSKENVLAIGAFFVDLDASRTRLFANLTPYAMAYKVYAYCRDSGFPVPSLINSSGRGLHCKWLLDAVPSAALPRWEACQRALVKRFAHFGADPAAKDVSRVLRAIGTKNPKSQTYARNLMALPTAAAPERYDFEDLCGRLLPFDRKALASLKANRKARQRSQKSLLPDQPVDEVRRSAARVALREYNIRRAEEVVRIAKDRGGMPEGMRLTATFIALCSLALAGKVTPGTLSADLRQLAAAIAPKWAVNAGEFVTLRGKIRDALHGRVLDWNGRRISPIPTYKTETIVEALRITDNEILRLNLKVLISPEVRRTKRAAAMRERRRAAGCRTGEVIRRERVVRRQEAVRLRAKGLTILQIARRMRISKSTAGRLVRGIRRGFPTCVAISSGKACQLQSRRAANRFWSFFKLDSPQAHRARRPQAGESLLIEDGNQSRAQEEGFP